MGKILGNEELNKLPTKVNYSYFNENKGNCNNVDFYDSTKNRLRDYEELQDFYDKIMNALCYVYNESASSSFDKNICDYLYYWLSDIIVTHLKNKSLYGQVLDILYAVLYKDKDINKPICKPIYYTMNENDIKKFKLIFDYSQDYNTYMTQLTKDNHPCNEKYQKYLQNYVNIYKEMQSKCEGKKNSNKYCEYFEKYFPDKYIKGLSTWTCELEKTKEYTSHISGGSSGDLGGTQLKQTLREGSGSGEQARTSDPHLDGRSTGVDITPKHSDDPPTPITSKGITAMASTAGFLVPSFLMYKVISIISIVI
ncbi:hypothetical protein PVNG_04999 [Plasmodium vivax North Korean]|uniref:Variable surface protein Vir7-like protein n=1 Tax=Plasmodium vivax North Korean TaxID=1035514 RepID=A0A0J9U321_PLAVI|nr:hypothetical protein PVNG_04999 [Plasmodium vivax North Korean]